MRFSHHGIAFLSFLAFYLLLLIDVHHWGSRDPGSAFFDPETAFERVYSLRREEEALEHIESFAPESPTPRLGTFKAGGTPKFCVGIPTVQRDGARYFRRAMGSLLQGLTERERRDIWVMPFVVNLDPTEHQALGEPWLERVADQVLTYNEADEGTLSKLKNVMAGDSNNRKKAVFDYIHLLRACYDKNTPWILIAEDDTIAADGWFKRTYDATLRLENSRGFAQALYLRLFYNERLLGWNNEEWFSYVLRIILLEVAVLATLVLASVKLPYGRTILTPLTIATITFLIFPLLIAATFLTGRLTLFGPSYGLNKMNTYGCCSQAFAFPRDQVPDLLAWYEKHLSGYIDPVTGADKTQVDSMTEIYADKTGLQRWAITPALFQHVGGTSTKPTSVTRWGRSNVENIWNFGFERLDGEELRWEHLS